MTKRNQRIRQRSDDLRWALRLKDCSEWLQDHELKGGVLLEATRVCLFCF